MNDQHLPMARPTSVFTIDHDLNGLIQLWNHFILFAAASAVKLNAIGTILKMKNFQLPAAMERTKNRFSRASK